MQEQQKEPQLELCLGGVARDLVREIPLQVKLNGAVMDLNDGNGPQQLTGAAFILNGLAGRFMPPDEEQNLRSISDLHGFMRMPGETIDTVLVRWEVVVQRARVRGGIPVTNQHAAWMLLLALRIPPTDWVTLLAPTRGRLPVADNEYRDFLDYLKRHGHLWESAPGTMTQGVIPGQSIMMTTPPDNSAYPTNFAPGLCFGGNSSMFGSGMATAPMYVSTTLATQEDGDWSDSDTSDEDEAENVYFLDNDVPDMTDWSNNDIGLTITNATSFTSESGVTLQGSHHDDPETESTEALEIDHLRDTDAHSLKPMVRPLASLTATCLTIIPMQGYVEATLKAEMVKP